MQRRMPSSILSVPCDLISGGVRVWDAGCVHCAGSLLYQRCTLSQVCMPKQPSKTVNFTLCDTQKRPTDMCTLSQRIQPLSQLHHRHRNDFTGAATRALASLGAPCPSACRPGFLGSPGHAPELRAHTHTHTHTNKYTHARTYTHTHTHTHTHTAFL